jgi:cation-transporting P-type ATPase 13A2
VGGLILIALVGFLITIPSFINHHYTLEATILRFLDLVTTAVPPALPAVLTSGIIYSLARLRQREIYCISPTRLNISGMIKTVVFDKTGTLTEDGLRVLGHRSVYKTSKKILKYTCLTDDIIHHSLDAEGCGNKYSVHLKYAMACCQSTKHIGDKLIGNPHDIKIFEYIGWHQVDRLNDRNGYAYTNVRPSDKNFPEDKDTNKKFDDDKVELKILK